MSFPSEWLVSSLGAKEDEIQSAPKPSASSERAESIPTHLFLHFDINETILLGDDAGGDSRNESVQKMLAKSAFCKIPTLTEGSPPWETTKQMKPTHWWDGQEIGRETSMPPLYTGWTWPDRCVPYYRTAHKKHAKSFSEDGKHGQIYGPLLEACEASLSSSRNYSIPSSSRNGKEHANNTILPAFYETLQHLVKSTYQKESSPGKGGKNQPTDASPPFTVVFRTFGSDLSEIAKVVTAFAKGDHTDYPDIDFPPFCLPDDKLYRGRWKVVPPDAKDDNDNDNNAKNAAVPGARAIYQLWTYDESELVASGDSEILEFLGKQTILGIRDDYRFWNANRYSPKCGKPIWVPSYRGTGSDDEEATDDASGKPTPYSHHLFFDDNIHNLPDDGIACIRKESTANDGAVHFESVDGAAMGEYQGVHLVRVPTVEPVLNPQWYVGQIQKARNRLQHRLRSQQQ